MERSVMSAGEPLLTGAGVPLQSAFKKDQPGYTLMGRTPAEEMARRNLDDARTALSGPTDVMFGTGMTQAEGGQPNALNMQLENYFLASDDPVLRAEGEKYRDARQIRRNELIEAEKAFFEIANEVDKLDFIPGAGVGGRAMPNVRGPLQEIRRAEQKREVYDEAARERGQVLRKRRGLGSVRGGGSGSSVTGLSDVSVKELLLGG